MFKAFTFKSLASLSLIVAVACIGAAEPALAKKKKQPDVPGHWERSEDGGFDWVGKKSKKPKNVQPVVRDHRNGASGGVTVTDTSQDPIVRDHRAEPVVRDHRNVVVRDNRKKKKIFGMPVWN